MKVTFKFKLGDKVKSKISELTGTITSAALFKGIASPVYGMHRPLQERPSDGWIAEEDLELIKEK